MDPPRIVVASAFSIRMGSVRVLKPCSIMLCVMQAPVTSAAMTSRTRPMTILFFMRLLRRSARIGQIDSGSRGAAGHGRIKSAGQCVVLQSNGAPPDIVEGHEIADLQLEE